MSVRKGLATLALFLGLSSLLLVVSAGHFFVTDDICYYFMARSFVDHGGFDVPPASYNHNLRIAQQGKDGKYYAPYAFGHALYLAAWLTLADALAPVLSAAWAPSFFLSFTHSVTTAATWTLFILLLEDFGLRKRRALLVGLAALFSSLAFPYARSLFPEPLLALCLVFALFCFRRKGKAWWLFSACGALSLAFGVTVRPTSAVFFPALWLLLWKQIRDNQPEGPKSGLRLRAAFFFAAAVLITLGGPALCVGFNYARFAQFTTTGYRSYENGAEVGFNTPLWFGLAVFLVSPGKAVWLFNPLLLLSALGMKRLYREDRLAALAIGWVFVSNLVIHAKWCEPEGGHSWGPRFFVGILPLLLLPAAVFMRDHLAGTGSKVLIVFLVMLGILVQFYGTAVNPAFALRIQGMLSPNARIAEYQRPDGRYNLWFSPFRLHHAALRDNAAAGLTVRHPLVRKDTARYLIIGFPHWADGWDFWPVHLIKEGFPKTKVAAAFWLLLGAGCLLLSLSYALARSSEERSA